MESSNRILVVVPTVLAALLRASTSQADTLTFKNGAVMSGKYAGGTDTSIKFETPEGEKDYRVSDIAAMTFEEAKPEYHAPPPAPPAPGAEAVTPAAQGPLIAPAGSILTVRMDTQVSSQDAGGKKFTGKLEFDLFSGDVVVAQAGTSVYGQVEESRQAGRLAGRSQLQMTLTGISFGGRLVPIMTTNFEETGKGSFQKTARNAGMGALIGGAFNGGKGAGRGAAVGVGASLIRQGDLVTVPVGAILEFRLTQPLTAP